jgi:hypothetical protein
MCCVAAIVLCVGLIAPLSNDQTTTSKPQRPARTAASAAKMTNHDVIQMISAGLSDQVIIGSIRQASAKNFDLSPMGLVALKKGGASDALIVFMQTGEAPASSDAVPAVGTPPDKPAVSTEKTAAPSGSPAIPPVVVSEDGVYYVDGPSVHRIEARTPYQTRTGSTAVSRLTLGIKKARLNAMLPGLSADLQVSQSPKFYVHTAENESVGEYYLIRFTVKQAQGRRELEVGSAGLGKAQAGFAEKDIYLIEAKRLEKNIYVVTPKVALPAGEYSLLVVPQVTGSGQTGLTPRKIFDFGVR